MRFGSYILRKTIDSILPCRCPLCGSIVANDHDFCLTCWQMLDFISEPWCHSCGIPFAFEHGRNAVCGNCLTSTPDHDGVRAVVVYDDNSGKIAMGLKYSAKLGLANLIAKHLAKFGDEFGSGVMLIPVPLHRTRLWERGFNQSLLIAKALSKLTDIPFTNGTLIRRKATPPLRDMSAKKRQQVVNDAIAVKKNIGTEVKNRDILLIDDVYTTGATANACARLLKRAGARTVVVLCWARVVSSSDQV